MHAHAHAHTYTYARTPRPDIPDIYKLRATLAFRMDAADGGDAMSKHHVIGVIVQILVFTAGNVCYQCYHLVIFSISFQPSLAIDRYVNKSTNQLINQSIVNQSIINKTVPRSTNQSIDIQPLDQSTNCRSINQSTNQTIGYSPIRL